MKLRSKVFLIVITLLLCIGCNKKVIYYDSDREKCKNTLFTECVDIKELEI